MEVDPLLICVLSFPYSGRHEGSKRKLQRTQLSAHPEPFTNAIGKGLTNSLILKQSCHTLAELSELCAFMPVLGGLLFKNCGRDVVGDPVTLMKQVHFIFNLHDLPKTGAKTVTFSEHLFQLEPKFLAGHLYPNKDLFIAPRSRSTKRPPKTPNELGPDRRFVT